MGADAGDCFFPQLAPHVQLTITGAWILASCLLLLQQGALVVSREWPFINAGELKFRLQHRLGQMPRYPEVKVSLCIAILGSVGLLAFGFLAGFVRLGLPGSWTGALKKFVITFFLPALVEEALFRGMLIKLPSSARRSQGRPASPPGCLASGDPPPGPGRHTADAREIVPLQARKLWCNTSMHGANVDERPPRLELVVALCIFIVYHLDAIHVQCIFQDPRFLVLAAILGFCCQEACVRTTSLWPGVLMHWLWVWGWLTFLAENPP